MKVFVSYRRSDCQDMAARIVDRLKERLGLKNVFFDVESIDHGADFVESITSSLEKCDMCLVLVGNNWQGVTEEGESRLAKPEDYVRQEVAVALSSGKRVIPVLINNANMPEAAGLPDEVQQLTTRNAVFVRHHSFAQDVEFLIDTMHGRKMKGGLGAFMRRRPVTAAAIRSGLGLLAALVALLVIAILHNTLTGRALDQTFGRGGVMVLIFLVLTGGMLAPNFLRRK